MDMLIFALRVIVTFILGTGLIGFVARSLKAEKQDFGRVFTTVTLALTLALVWI